MLTSLASLLRFATSEQHPDEATRPMTRLPSSDSSASSTGSWSSGGGLPTLSLSAGNFLINRSLGRGSNGIVYEASLSDGSDDSKRYAIKVPRHPKGDLRHECKIASILAERTQCTMPCTEGRMPDGTICLIMPVAQGTVEGLAGRCSSTMLRWLVHDIGDALVAAHDLGIAHGDVKPEQIFALKRAESDRQRFALGDYGFSSFRRVTEVRGSPAFMDEASYRAYMRWRGDREFWEVFADHEDRFHPVSGIAIDLVEYDIHAFALTILVLIVGDHIVDFHSDDAMQIWFNALRFDLDWMLGRFKLTPEACDVLAMALDPNQRTSMCDFVDAAKQIERWTR